jgi:molybdopterin molybdotransferase
MDNLLSVTEALQRLLDRFTPVETEILPISKLRGFILAEDIVAESDLPFFTNSSMDGYAVRAIDVQQASHSQPTKLRVVADIPAGIISDVRIGKLDSARIMTGAPLPEGADAVVPVEFTNQKFHLDNQELLDDEELQVYQPVKSGDYIRWRGEDIKAGKVVIPSGSRLRPQDIGLMAMLGITKSRAFRQPKVAMFSTGDELLPIEAPLRPGKIHDSNAYTIAASIEQDGGVPIYLGIVPDREDAIRAALDRAIVEEVDLILSSAGVSVGAFDYVRSVVEKNGRLDFWRVNMRPGKPLAFGEYRDIPFIGLPGNPVSAFVGYEVFVRPSLMKLAGIMTFGRLRIKVKLDEEITSDGRESYLRAIVKESDGQWIASLTGHQGSGNLLSLVQANALLIIPSGVKSLPSWTEVDAWLIGN